MNEYKDNTTEELNKMAEEMYNEFEQAKSEMYKQYIRMGKAADKYSAIDAEIKRREKNDDKNER